ncbi:hypothetical protein V6N13_018814 [Hibiscus sabdariffa]
MKNQLLQQVIRVPSKKQHMVLREHQCHAYRMLQQIGSDPASMILPVLAMGTFQHPGTAGPISGQSNGAADGGSSRISAKQPSQRSAPPPADGMYRAPTIGQPVGGPLVSAVSRPVNLPAPAHLGYGVTVPCAPMNMTPAGCEAATYPMPHTTTDR